MKTANTTGRLVFARDALQDAPARIDRVELETETIHLAELTRRDRTRFSNALGRSELFEGYNPSGHRQNIRSDRLVSGCIKFLSGPPDQISFKFKLYLNLTRFLQYHGAPSSRYARQNLQEYPGPNLIKALDQEGNARLQRAENETLDRSNNFITNDVSEEGVVSYWQERFEEYVKTVIYAVAEDIFQAVQACSERAQLPLDHYYQQLTEGVPWKVRQAEFYWEFAVDSSVRKMRSIANDLCSTFRDGYLTELPVHDQPRSGRERNSPYVRGALERDSIYGKMYAKSSDVLRFEVQYSEPPSNALGREYRVSAPFNQIFPMMRRAELDASQRACRFWDTFWSMRSGPSVVGLSTLYELINKVYRACEGTGVSPSSVLELLTQYGNGEPLWPTRIARSEPMRNLRDAGVLVQMVSSSNRRVRYQLVPLYCPLVRQLPSAFPDTEAFQPEDEDQSALFEDEDAVPRRVRCRTMAFPTLYEEN